MVENSQRERRLQHQLEIQSMQIERVFSRHQLPVQVAGGKVRPRVIRFDLHTGLTQGVERLKALKDELVQVLGSSGIVFGQDNGRFSVDVARDEDTPVPLMELLPMLDDVPPFTAVMGLAEDERPVFLTFAEEDMSHIFIAGDRGAGKTTLIRTMALSLAMHSRQSQLQMLVCCPGGDEHDSLSLEPLNYLPHMLAGVIKTPAETKHIINFLLGEIDYRQEQHIRRPTIVFFMDHVVGLLLAGNGELQKPVTRLLRRGADVGIHLVMTTERPGDEMLAPWLKADLPVRIVGRVANSETAQIAAGVPDSQAEYLLGGGDFLAMGDKEMTRFQAAYVGNYDLHMALEDLHRKKSPALLAQTVNTRPKISEVETAVTTESERPFVYNGQKISLETASRQADTSAVQKPL